MSDTIQALVTDLGFAKKKLADGVFVLTPTYFIRKKGIYIVLNKTL